jgi:putative Ca2+/H+ antiporter (TMEM165/GDT1 family)
MLTAFLLATGLVFAAEMGDKTQLVALAFATRYKTSTVLAGVFVATILVHLLSVFLGEAAGMFIPLFWIKVAAGIAFLIFGLWTIRGDELGDEDKVEESRWGPLLTVGIAFFIAELGDKTMLMTVTIASQQQSFVGVWLGSTVGMVLADGIAIVVGKILGKNLPEKVVKYGAAVVFFVSGLYILYEAFTAAN